MEEPTVPRPSDHSRQRPKEEEKWWVQTSTLLLFIWCLLGVGVAVGHHCWYAYLDGRKVEDQSWVLRGGTVTALLAKFMFSSSIGIAFAQRVWSTVREKHMTLPAVDGMMELLGGASRFLNLEILGNAKLASLIALSSWALVILPVLVPTSISIVSESFVTSRTNAAIQNLDFSRDPLSSRNDSVTGWPLYSLPLALLQGVGAAFNSYENASEPARGFVYQTMYGQRRIDPVSPCGANCTFTQSFAGPAYQCRDIDYVNTIEPGNPFCLDFETKTEALCNLTSMMDLDSAGPTKYSRKWYDARGPVNGVCTNALDNATCGTMQPWKDGKLWVYYTYLPEEYRTEDAGKSEAAKAIPEDVWERHIFVCQSYNATYTLQRSYINFQHVVNTSIEYMHPIDYSVTIPPKGDRTEGYAAFAIHQTLFSLLAGTIAQGAQSIELDRSSLGGSALVEVMPFPRVETSVFKSVASQKPVRDLRRAVEELHQNITIGLLSLAPQLLYSIDDVVEVEQRSSQNIWVYNWHILAASYGAALLLDLFAVSVAIVCMARNEGCAGLGFMRAVATTGRSPGLAARVQNWNSGLDPVPKDVTKTKIMFGALAAGDHGFGVKGEVIPLRKVTPSTR